MVDDVHEPIDDEEEELHLWPPADFCGFGLCLEHAVPIHRIFLALPFVNENIARWWNGYSSAHLSVLEYTDMDHCCWVLRRFLTS